MSDITAIRERTEAKNRAVAQSREVLDRIDEEGRAPTADEEALVERALADVTRLNEEISGLQEERVVSRRLDDVREEWVQRVSGDRASASAVEPAGTDRASTAHQIVEMAKGNLRGVEINIRPAWEARQRERGNAMGASSEQRALSVGTDTAGGKTVFDEFVRRLYDYMEIFSGARNTMPTVITTMTGEDLRWPRVTDHGTVTQSHSGTNPATYVVSEAGSITGTDAKFDEFTLKAYKYGQIVQLSNELIQDTGVNLLDWLAMDMGRAIARATDWEFVNGTGTIRPTGLFGAADSLVNAIATGTTGVAGKPSFDDLYDLKYSVDEAYRGTGALFFMNDRTTADIAKLKDSDNQYLWQPAKSESDPDTIIGHRIVTDPHIALAGTGATSVMFGDFKCFVIRDVGTIRFERSDEFGFATDQVAYRIITRTDSNIIDKRGLARFKGGAS